MSRFNATLDKNNRMCMPYKFRCRFDGSFVIAKNLAKDVQCLQIYTLNQWREFKENTRTKLSTQNASELLRFMRAEEINIDTEGRFLIPQQLRTYAKLQDSVIIIDLGEHLEIWNEEDLEKVMSMPCDFLDLLENA